MAAELFNRYIWLVDTIYSAGRISLDEINRRWQRSLYNEKHEDGIPERSFHRHKDAIKSMFDIDIRCDKSDGNRYYIDNVDDLGQDGLRKWLINTFAVNNLIHESHTLKRRILLEEIPSGQRFLTRIIEAMRDNRTIELLYRNFNDEKSHLFEVEPFCVKVFKQRWYLVARSVKLDQIRIYGLDRIEKMQVTDNVFRFPDDFDAQQYFTNCYGIIANDNVAVEHIRIRVDARQREYLLSLPLHPSQTETERTSTYSIVEFYLRPTFDFQQEIRSHGASMEILAPEWLRTSFAEEAQRVAKIYRQ